MSQAFAATIGTCASLLWLGCEGSAPPGAAPESEATEIRFACDDRAGDAPAELRRLTMTQYESTLRDLVAWALGDAIEAERVIASAGLERLPADRREPTPQAPHGGLRRLDQALDPTHVEETFHVAVALGRALSAPERLGVIAGRCAIAPGPTEGDETCVMDFIHRFGARALRRPLEDEDARFYRAVYGSDPAPDPAAYADVITVMLSAPEFLYFVEHGEDELQDAPGSYRLSAYELASRLSYHFWQTLPDDALWQAAQDGSLLEPAVLAREVERLMADERARTTPAEFFHDLLGLEDVPPLDTHARDPVFAAFAGEDLPGPELRQQAIDEALDLVDHHTWTDPAGFEALLTSELSFARGDALARIYGVPPWDGSSTPPSLPAGERAGLLERLWFLASGSATTRPIRRGVFVRRTLLCDALEPPPAGAAAVLPEPAPDETTREGVEALTEQPGTPCAACHTTFINPLGFAFEGFDALGRVRTEQSLFGPDGTHLGALPVDTVTVPRVTEGDARVSTGPRDLARLMLQSGKLEACLARHYFRFIFGRLEDLERDGCALERLRSRLVQTGRIRDMLAEAGLLPELRRRRLEP